MMLSVLRCIHCGERFPIQRTGRSRPRGHVKHLWCTKCKQRTGHVEGGLVPKGRDKTW